MDNKKKCFVIMPISGTESCTEDEWTGIFNHMIKPAVTGSKLGFACERAKPRHGSFIKDILEGLNRSDLVIADLTDRNPNVCYELGIRHTLKNRTILVAQNMDDVPSDLQSYWVVTYQKDLTGAEEFKKSVRRILREMQDDPDKSDSPVADFLTNKNIDLLSIEKKTNLRKLSALLCELSYDIAAMDEVNKTINENEQARAKGKMGDVSSLRRRLDNTCQELLITTNYILLSEDLVEKLRYTNLGAKLLNSILQDWSASTHMENYERKMKGSLPTIQKVFIDLFQSLNKLKQDYAQENYQEPREPVIILADPKHEEYLKPTL